MAVLAVSHQPSQRVAMWDRARLFELSAGNQPTMDRLKQFYLTLMTHVLSMSLIKLGADPKTTVYDFCADRVHCAIGARAPVYTRVLYEVYLLVCTTPAP